MSGQYDTPLQLTTPHMHGQKVKDAQYLMAGNNKIHGLATYKDGAIDGDYGTLTAQATWRTKYWCGYPASDINRSFGQQLYEYLLPSSDRRLPADFLTRRNQRLKAAEQSVGKKALDLAITQIGTREAPAGSNRQKYGLWFGFNGVPWCAIFASWCFAHSGYTRFRYSYVPAVHGDATFCRNQLCVIRTPRPGDLALFNFGYGNDVHIEFFERWTSGTTAFSSVGGNTGADNWANGGAVERNTRYRQNVDAFVRVAG